MTRRGIVTVAVLGVAAVGGWSLHGPGPELSTHVPSAAVRSHPARTERVLPTPPAPADSARVEAALAKLPVYFVENQGQEDGRVGYVVRGRETNVYFTGDGVTFSLRDPAARVRQTRSSGEGSVRRVSRVDESAERAAAEAGESRRWTVKLEFIGANPGVTPRGRDVTPAVVSYFTGPRSQWKTGVRTYGAVVYEELWPGIDMVYDGAGGRLKYTFLVKPGADPSQIRLAYRGSTGMSVTDAGELKISTPVGPLTEAVPYSYQEVEGRRVEVSTSYAVSGQRAGDAGVVSFHLGAYDASRPLVVDPATFVYVGYIGGSGDEVVFGIAVDTAGNAYVTGQTSSTTPSFPAQVGPDLVQAGGDDAFVVKIRADGTGLVYAGFIGGAGDDRSRGIAVDATGSAYIVGRTDSSEATFPVTVGPSLVYGGNRDAFVAKISADGTTLVYCGYVGGANEDEGTAIAVDASGHAYIAGRTFSDAASFPVNVGPSLSHGGNLDGFVAKVSPEGDELVYAGYIGGADRDYVAGIAVDSSGHAFVVGRTESDPTTFPVRVGPRLTYGGDGDAFIAKVTADGSGFVYAGYIGGSGEDIGNGVAVDAQGNAYVGGTTGSSAATFPITVGPSLVKGGFGYDAFVAKVRADGNGFVYAGFIGGGSGIEGGNAIAVDAAGNAYVAGFTASDESTFPVRNGPFLVHQGSTDAFVAKVRADGSGLAYAGYIGGNDFDRASGIVVDAAGNAYVAGDTESLQDTFPVMVGPSLLFGGGSDGFVAKISGGSGPDLVVTALSDPPASATVDSHFSVTVTVQNQGLTNAPSSQTRFYLSLDATRSADDVQLTGTRNTGSLVPGATASGSVTLTVPETVTAGTFYLLACADGASAVAENDEDNNCRAAAARVQINLPDLVVTALTHTGGPFGPGSTISATATTANQGVVPTGTSTATRFYLSADAGKSADDYRFSTTHSVSSLLAGGSAQATKQLTIPTSMAPGIYFLLACADDTVKVTETNELNNCTTSSSGQITFGVPNLTATIDTLSISGALRPGQSFQVHDTTRNDSGIAVTVSTTTRYLFSTDTVRSSGDLSLSTRTVAALGTGQTSGVTRTLTVPATIPTGTYRLLVCADDAGVVTETSETDNCAVSSAITVALPDLIEQSVSTSASIVAAGHTFTVSDTTRNAGAGPAASSTTRYYLSVNQTKSTDDRLLSGTSSRAALPPGNTIASGRSVTVPSSMPPGQYFVLACADDLHAVTETSENNNCGSSAARITIVP